MFKKIKLNIKKNLEILTLGLLIVITITFTSYYNYNKKKILSNYSSLIDNIYFKKSINQILDNLEPRFKKIEHEINVGETFDQILEMQMPEIIPFENIELENEFKSLSDKLNLD